MRRPRALGAGFIGVLLVVVCAFAELGQQGSNERLDAVSMIHSEPITVRRGTRREARVTVVLREGFHINSNRPGSDLLKPTVLHVEAPAGIVVGKLRYPAPQELVPEFAPKERLKVYGGRFAIGVPLTAKRNAKQGKQEIRGELSFQACNDRACFAPKKLPVTIEVVVQ